MWLKLMTTEVKSAYLYPGQGLAPKDIIDCHDKLKNVSLDLTQNRIGFAQDVLNKVYGAKAFNIAATLKDKDSPNFKMTSFVQTVVYTLSVITSEIMRAQNPARAKPNFVAGHSLGEYSALTEAGVVEFKNGIEIVTFRGLVMQEACQDNPSSLVSINGLNEELVKDKVCQQTGAEIALINAPTLIVVGVSKEGVVDIEKLANEAGARRVSVLPTAGAFHTKRFMQEASSKLAEFTAPYEFSDPQIPFVPNLTGEPSFSRTALKNHLPESMVNPVRWAKGLQFMRDTDVRLFVEVGPGTSLASLNKINGIPEEQTINALDQLLAA